jgi:phosphatidylglycerophosphatase A
MATQVGVGLLPKAPGTWGTILALPIAYYASYFSPIPKLIFWSGLLLAGIWAAARYSKILGVCDSSQIVIDEGVGFGFSVFFLGPDPRAFLVAFALFRIFDIAKLPPARQVDRWSKKAGTPRTSGWKTGFGIMADDLIAAGQTILVLIVLKHLMILE